MARARYGFVIALALASAACGHLPGRSSPSGAVVVRVVDGDTVVLRLAGVEESSRIIGVDTPETVKPDTPVQCFGPEASHHLKALLPPGTPVRVARDVEARDHFGRLLVYVWRRADGHFVNLDLVAGGWGRPLSIAPNTAYRTTFSAAADAARAAGRGLWSACPLPDGPR